MSAESKSPYRFQRAVIEEQSDAILRVWRENLEHPAPAEKFTWLYSDQNPADAGLIYLLIEEKSNEVVGVSCLAHRQFVYNNQNYDAGILADFAVDKKHRSLGPALNLTKTTVDAGVANFDFLYGFPNRNAQPVMRRAGCEVIGQMTRYARVMDSAEFLARRFPTFIAKVIAPFVNVGIRISEKIPRVLSYGHSITGCENVPPDIDSLFSAASQNWLIARRDSKTLAWRHFKDPEATLKKLIVLTSAKQEVVGYLVYQLTDQNMLQVDDFLAKDPNTLKLLFLHFFKVARIEKVRSVSVEFFGDNSVIDILHGLMFRSRNQRPIVAVRGREATKPNPLDLLEKWFLTSSDEDG